MADDRDPNGNVVRLREYTDMLIASMERSLDMRFEGAERSVREALAASEKAIAKAEAASERRFEGVNEFRSALSDNARLMMPRSEAEHQYGAMSDRVNRLEEMIRGSADKDKGSHEVWLILIALAGIATGFVSVLVHFMKP